MVGSSFCKFDCCNPYMELGITFCKMWAALTLFYWKRCFTFLCIDVIYIAFWSMTCRTGNDFISILWEFKICIDICHISSFEIGCDKIYIFSSSLLYIFVPTIATICNQNSSFFGYWLFIQIVLDLVGHFPDRHRKSADFPGKLYWKTVALYHALFQWQ